MGAEGVPLLLGGGAAGSGFFSSSPFGFGEGVLLAVVVYYCYFCLTDLNKCSPAPVPALGVAVGCGVWGCPKVGWLAWGLLMW